MTALTLPEIVSIEKNRKATTGARIKKKWKPALMENANVTDNNWRMNIINCKILAVSGFFPAIIYLDIVYMIKAKKLIVNPAVDLISSKYVRTYKNEYEIINAEIAL